MDKGGAVFLVAIMLTLIFIFGLFGFGMYLESNATYELKTYHKTVECTTTYRNGSAYRRTCS